MTGYQLAALWFGLVALALVLYYLPDLIRHARTNPKEHQ